MRRSQARNDETDRAEWLVRCTGCGISLRNPIPDCCQRCGFTLEVELDYGEELQTERLVDCCITDLWKYGSLYPVSLRHSMISARRPDRCTGGQPDVLQTEDLSVGDGKRTSLSVSHRRGRELAAVEVSR